MRTYSKTFLIILVLIFTLGVITTQAQDPATVRILTMQQAAMTPDEMQAVADEFNAANPGTVVELEFVSYDALHDKIVTAMATEPPPYDAILIDVIWYPEFAQAGKAGVTIAQMLSHQAGLPALAIPTEVMDHQAVAAALAALPIATAGPNGGFAAIAAGNVDNDVTGIDKWFVSSQGALTTTANCVSGTSDLQVAAGVPGRVYDDVDCNN